MNCKNCGHEIKKDKKGNWKHYCVFCDKGITDGTILTKGSHYADNCISPEPEKEARK